MDKRNTRNLLFLLFILICKTNFSQEVPIAIDAAFKSLQTRPPMEKLYLQLDKTSYNSGGTIWFKGYLLTATGHAPFAWSKFIYVELFDKSDSLIYRKKIKEQDGVFSGNIKLETDLPDADYVIRAYSFWMLNSGLDYLFTKTIHISNFQLNPIQSQIEYQKNKNGTTTATISFFNNKGVPIENTRVKCTLRLDDEKLEFLSRKTNLNGEINFEFTNENPFSKKRFIEVAFENSSKTYQHRFFIPATENNDFDIQFFPEGGELILDCPNKIAFKAIAKNGYSTEVSGSVFDSKNDTILKFHSQHLGLGSFELTPQTNKKYVAVVKNPEGITKRFLLPDATTKVPALTINQNKNMLRLKIRTNKKNPQKPYFIFAHSCENLIFAQQVEKLQYNIPLQNLPDGIVHFVLTDNEKHTVSSRMVFIKAQSAASVSVQSDKENYQQREIVSLSIQLQKKDTILRNGNFSISVTDDQVVPIDSLANNIYTCLLLTSDLKGHIENPAFYFLNNADSTNRYLDLLMLTQGWQRFNVENVLQNKMEKPIHFLELGQTISGHYEKRLLQKKGSTEITALAVNPIISASTQTDEKGFFIFNELDFRDSTIFTIQSQRYSNIKHEPAGIITLDKDTFPRFENTQLTRKKQNPLFGKYLANTQERMYYEGDGRVIILDEFVVTATDKTKNYQMEYGISSTVFDEDAISKKFPIIRTADFIVKTLPGITVKGDAVYIRGNTIPAEILLDGMETELSTIYDINSPDISKIVVIKGAGAALYSRNGGMGGVILINMKEGGSFNYKLQGVEKYMPLGYQKPAEFYVPKYNIDSIRNSREPDMRSTIYWNPNISLDSNEKANVNFYTADPNANYTYILEGVTNLGEICRFVGRMKRNKK